MGDLSAKYLGRKIRAQGTIIRDERQWLLIVKTPDQIALFDEPAKSPAAGEMTIINERGKHTAFKIPLSADLPRRTVKLMHDGEEEAWEGVSIADLLAQAGIPMGAESRGTLLGRYMIVRAQDKYAAVFSLFEVDPFYVEPTALLAESLNGQALKATRAPLQVVMPGDLHRRRWVGQAVEIEVRNALEPLAAGAH